MVDSAAKRMRALELRYDGPIPGFHGKDAARSRRRERGKIAALELQAAEFLDAAIRCEMELAEAASACEPDALAANCPGLPQTAAALRRRLDAHIACAAEALSKAIPLRQRLGLGRHPLLDVAWRTASSRSRRAD